MSGPHYEATLTAVSVGKSKGGHVEIQCTADLGDGEPGVRGWLYLTRSGGVNERLRETLVTISDGRWDGTDLATLAEAVAGAACSITIESDQEGRDRIGFLDPPGAGGAGDLAGAIEVWGALLGGAAPAAAPRSAQPPVPSDDDVPF